MVQFTKELDNFDALSIKTMINYREEEKRDLVKD
eukprot:CAMPEP_0170548676 /NCGR_PEP_ID=MMETSP0211-20121228/6918_1 /TAXON_ID=311385 /ORGANISM="Pseudokeronopsis sp., Strain OXSARD2" /LENGTH=33 /DNA_ID= /DNA_START= /DNA_END= /DNA_ORIENTATION=